MRVAKTYRRTEGLTLTVPVTTLKKKNMSKNSFQYEIGDRLSFISLSLCVWSQINGRSGIARLWTRSSFRTRSIDCGVSRVRYAERLTVMVLASLV